MGFWSSITGTTPQAEQDAQLAAKQAEFERRNQARLDAGTETQAQFEDNLNYIQNVKLDSTTTAAALGALEGATELNYNPGQWWQDEQSGFNTVSSGVSGAVSKAIESVKSAIPNFKWVAIVLLIVLFVWAGGLNLIAGKLSKK